ncbi:hypothetical protein [Tunturiibacter lichenicola]|uniref:hypothetical protein n=1 Tax=Tunturiibacter lichenicola TaxID=2051959 RepID=UPI0021B1EBE0|nr:hypothetical protein [Edaphobacter lichenicola]
MVATSPVLMKTFAAVFANVHSGSFAEGEIQIVLLTDALCLGRLHRATAEVITLATGSRKGARSLPTVGPGL